MLNLTRSKAFLRIIFALLAISIGRNVTGQELITDRPDQTESSSTIAKGSLQIESGIVLAFEGEAGTRQLLAPTTLFRYAPVNNFELRVVSQFESVKEQQSTNSLNGISDLEVGAKLQVFKKEYVNIEVAFLSHAVLPTGTFSADKKDVAVVNKICFSHRINAAMELGYNFGYNINPQTENDLTYSIALGVAINDKLGLYIEPYGDVIAVENHISNFDAGFTYLAKENVQLDFSFGTGINHTMNYLSIGVSWLIDKRSD
jgi:hypothetical protein